MAKLHSLYIHFIKNSYKKRVSYGMDVGEKTEWTQKENNGIYILNCDLCFKNVAIY